MEMVASNSDQFSHLKCKTIPMGRPVVFISGWQTAKHSSSVLLNTSTTEIQNYIVLFTDTMRGIFVHQSFVTTAPPPTGKGGDYDFSAFSALLLAPPQGATGGQNFALAPPFATENLPGVRIYFLNVKAPSFPLRGQSKSNCPAL